MCGLETGSELFIRDARRSEARLLSDLALRSKAHWGYPDDFLSLCREELAVTGDDIAGTHLSFGVAEMDIPSRLLPLYDLDLEADS